MKTDGRLAQVVIILPITLISNGHVTQQMIVAVGNLSPEFENSTASFFTELLEAIDVMMAHHGNNHETVT